ncbi:MAG: HlyD family efflux transporter periplasmic adaptor subunit [Ignavibacteriae bacterium]|nr:MAG: HlyD family efflux transporter periplasmic adaptor subunit [Ignavibacteriota bacterium]
MLFRLFALSLLITLASCSTNNDSVDGSGTFEAVETMISAEVSGRLVQFSIVDGQQVKRDELLGVIDTTQLVLKRQQLQAQVQAVLARKPHVATQIAALQEQLRGAKREHERLTKLVKADAATQKQLDDATTAMDVLTKQLDAQLSSLDVTTSSLDSETRPLVMQIAQIDDQLERSRLLAPFNGTVLTTYADPYELAVAGKALYKIADLSTLIMRAYITNDQLTQIKLGQNVKVIVDHGDTQKSYTGNVSWISDKAEFTPKTIQTKDERANLVYAVKIRVPNDGYLKIGMYGEITF